MWADIITVLENPDNSDILDELCEEKFISRTHGVRSTYAQGCRGPLCRKSERDRGRERHAKRMKARGRNVRPLPMTDEQERDELLDYVMSWHKDARSQNLKLAWPNLVTPEPVSA